MIRARTSYYAYVERGGGEDDGDADQVGGKRGSKGHSGGKRGSKGTFWELEARCAPCTAANQTGASSKELDLLNHYPTRPD